MNSQKLRVGGLSLEKTGKIIGLTTMLLVAAVTAVMTYSTIEEKPLTHLSSVSSRTAILTPPSPHTGVGNLQLQVFKREGENGCEGVWKELGTLSLPSLWERGVILPEGAG